MDVFAGRRLDSLTVDDLKLLVSRGEEESVHLDYKRELNIDDPNQQRCRNKRQEFLKDVTAFANSAGGLLVYGVEEEKDADGKSTGTPKELCGFDCPNLAQLKQTVENVISGGIDEPPYGHIEIEGIALDNGKHAFLMRIPSSLRAPHMVKLGGEQRFYRRVNTGSEPMTAAQIRDVAIQNASIEERIARQLEGRRDLLRRESLGQPFLLLHVVPLMRSPRKLDITNDKIVSRLEENCVLLHEGMTHHQRGTHGLLGYEIAIRFATEVRAYVLFGRDGTIEFKAHPTNA